MTKNYSVNEIRKMFLDFFESKEHLVMRSFSLVPHNDKSLLLINSGMAPLKPYFTGQEIPPKRRVATCQKCIRTGDIDNVGKTARHGTFFEMLGNFSFGDYFKHEAIAWTWEFLTEVVGLDKDRLYPSVYLDDEEAFDIWNKEIGIPAERIFRFGKADNFWEHGQGPCGPCSEVYYDRGEKYGCASPTCTVGCDCDRYMEVWNNVFTQFDSDGKGNYAELEQKNIDTGMGLERLAVAVQDVDSIFEVDTIKALLDSIAQLADVKYKDNEENDISLRVITDHIRSCTFMISDGIMPSNEGRGYVLRRLIRRAARHGRKLKINNKFMSDLALKAIELSKDGYPELEERKQMILKVLSEEEDRFFKTIDQGLLILEDYEKDMLGSGKKCLDGVSAFKLYDTYGFPIDLTKEILEEKGFDVDIDGFNEAMQVQKDTAREARKTTNYMGADVTIYQSLDPNITTEFKGYDSKEVKSKIVEMTSVDEIISVINQSDKGTIITEKTVFYATMGGQVNDLGVIEFGGNEFIVEDVVKIGDNKIGHVGYMKKGSLSLGDEVTLKIDENRRNGIIKNHSATHLLHKALREVLGSHVEQAGSLVDFDKLRFDFTHYSMLSEEELKKVEKMVNDEIKKGDNVCTDIMDLDEAKKSGATALFNEKYSGKVRVVSMGDFSKELCGGTHVKNTSDIGSFKILSEAGVAAGIRRIEAITSDQVMLYYESMENKLADIAAMLKTNISEIEKRIQTLINESKLLKSENDSLKSELAGKALNSAEEKVSNIKGINLVCMKLEGVMVNELRDLGDSLKNKYDNSVIVLISVTGDKVNLLVMASDNAVKQGAHAGNIIKNLAAVVGGGGGGRENMAQAGGKNPEKVDEAISKAPEIVENMIK